MNTNNVKDEEERPPSMIPLASLIMLLGIMFIFILAILSIVGNMHLNGVKTLGCSTAAAPAATCPTCPTCASGVSAVSYPATSCTGTCSTGTKQSPINIISGSATAATAEDTQYTSLIAGSWRAGNQISSGTTFNGKAWVTIKDSSVVISNIWSYFSYGGKDYRLAETKIHTPAEHKIDGTGFGIEVEMIFQAVDGKYLTVSALGNKGGSGSPTSLTAAATSAPSAGSYKTAQIDFNEMIKSMRTTCSTGSLCGDSTSEISTHYVYEGSLTAPPCTEGVTKIVLKEPFLILEEHLTPLSTLNGNNARPVQALGDRTVKTKS